MPTVTTSHTTQEDPAKVWEVLLDNESYPGYMAEVQDITVLRRDGDVRVSKWQVLLKGSELEWEEEEFIDHGRRRIDFRQIDGDLAYFTGHWQVSVDERGTTVELHVEFDIGIPMMSDLLNPVAARALEDNSRAMLAHLGDRAGTAEPERRR
ncbi:SRPBCC family protein [Streptomyces sp. ODS28]|uniref:type II toxin-antitoxin system RatA family toxin n=1 Tax=Streptomyces sp. ODS28 TaxID=3136688 RepID=UPI0031F0798C